MGFKSWSTGRCDHNLRVDQIRYEQSHTISDVWFGVKKPLLHIFELGGFEEDQVFSFFPFVNVPNNIIKLLLIALTTSRNKRKNYRLNKAPRLSSPSTTLIPFNPVLPDSRFNQ